MLHSTLNKLLTYYMLRSTQLLERDLVMRTGSSLQVIFTGIRGLGLGLNPSKNMNTSMAVSQSLSVAFKCLHNMLYRL